MEAMVKLLPCPRCGNTAELFQVDSHTWRISCNSNWKECDMQVDSTDSDCLPWMWNMMPRHRERKALQEIIEIYAGMDGFVAETAPEAYQERIIEQMYSVASDALKLEE